MAKGDVTYRKTLRRVKRLHEKAAAITDALEAEQQACGHPFLQKRNRGSTGNYDPSSDSYWAEYYCDVCDKRWVDEQKYEPGVREVRDEIVYQLRCEATRTR